MTDFETIGLMITAIISAMGIKEALLRYVSPREACGCKACVEFHNNAVNSDIKSYSTKSNDEP